MEYTLYPDDDELLFWDTGETSDAPPDLSYLLAVFEDAALNIQPEDAPTPDSVEDPPIPIPSWDGVLLVWDDAAVLRGAEVVEYWKKPGAIFSVDQDAGGGTLQIDGEAIASFHGDMFYIPGPSVNILGDSLALIQ